MRISSISSISSASSRRSWALRTFVVGCGLAAGGVALLVYGWWRISGEARAAAQLPYLASSTIPGAVLVVVGAIVVARIRAHPSDPRIDALVGLLTEPVQHEVSVVSIAAGGPGTGPGNSLVVVNGASHYHRAECLLVAGKVTSTYDDALEASGRYSACPLCTPGP